MSFLDNLTAEGRTLLLELGGEPILLRPASGGPEVMLTAIVERGEQTFEPAPDGRSVRRVRAVEVPTESADRLGTVVIDGAEYSIDRVGDTAGGLTRWHLVHKGAAEKSRPQFRK
jgi:hypothetical protein